LPLEGEPQHVNQRSAGFWTLHRGGTFPTLGVVRNLNPG
jgi:hypothetical protein